MKNTIIITVVLLTGLMFSLSCGKGSANEGNPILPEFSAVDRCALAFENPIPLFDTGFKTADVDTASVVWGFSSTLAQEFSGELVLFDDNTQWAVAVAIQERDPDYVWPEPPYPYLPASYPVIQFLGSDGSTLSEVFPVPVYPNPSPTTPGFSEHYCYTPKIDCTYTYSAVAAGKPVGFPQLEVDIAYRYSNNQYTWPDILATWDIRVTRMSFSYDYDQNNGWRWVWIPPVGGFPGAQLPDAYMQLGNSGQTHPDIAIDQASGDIYCAWTDLRPNLCSLYYKRYSNTAWSQFRYSLKYNTDGIKHDTWYVNLDIGLVSGLPYMGNPERVVGFAYTGLFTNETSLWGFRPVLGYWSIESGPDDANHPAQLILVNPDFIPGILGVKHNAGLPVIDIPADGVADHGAAVVFVQDEEDSGPGCYEVYGVSSLDYGPPGYTHISVPSAPFPEFAHGTLPSLAVHRNDGTMPSVTYFAKPDYGDWAVYATLWTLDAQGVIADPTPVDTLALGEFEMDANDFLYHDWGTASSLVLIDANDSYWATWSDKMDAAEPVGVKGVVGYTDN